MPSMSDTNYTSKEMKKDLSKIVKEEGKIAKELTDVSAKATDSLVHTAKDKYDDLEDKMKAIATERFRKE